MKILIDEQSPIQMRDVLRFLLQAHQVDHVDDLRWKSKKDAVLLRDAKQRGYGAFLTNDQNQLNDPVETRAILDSGIHHIRYQRRVQGLAGQAIMFGSVTAAMPLLMTELVDAPGQRLVKIRSVSRRSKDRFEMFDPRKHRPPYSR